MLVGPFKQTGVVSLSKGCLQLIDLKMLEPIERFRDFKLNYSDVILWRFYLKKKEFNIKSRIKTHTHVKSKRLVGRMDGATTSSITRHNDTQHNNTQHNDTQHNDTQHNNTQHNDTQHNDTGIVLLSVVVTDCHLCWVSHIGPLGWVSLCWMSLCWVSLCWMSQRRIGRRSDGQLNALLKG